MEELKVNPIDDLYLNLENLRSKVNQELDIALSTESLGFSDLVSNVMGFFSEGVTAIGNFFKEYSSGSLSRNEPLPHFERCKQSMGKVDTILNYGGDLYGKVVNCKVPYLQGCTMDLATLTTRLVEVSPDHKDIVLNCLDRLDTIISNLVTDNKYLSGFRAANMEKEFTEAEDFVKKIKELNEDLYKNVNDKNDIRTIKEVIPNLQSLDSIRSNLKELYKTMDNKFIGKVNNIATALHSKMNVITKESEISKNNLKGLSERLLIGAESLTYTATLYYLVTQSIYSFDALIKTIMDKR